MVELSSPGVQLWDGILGWKPQPILQAAVGKTGRNCLAIVRYSKYEGSMADGVERFLCIACYEKGHDFLRQCAEMG